MENERIIMCPSCNNSSRGEDWCIEGHCVHIVKAIEGEIYEEEDKQPTYWFSGATCPVCGEFFEFDAGIKLEWYERTGKLYDAISQALQKETVSTGS